jgi:hypothetical protein
LENPKKKKKFGKKMGKKKKFGIFGEERGKKREKGDVWNKKKIIIIMNE